MKIINIKPTFFRCAETLGRQTDSVTVIPSSWTVKFSDGSSKKYNITLSPDKLDPAYDSRKDPPKSPETYYIQVDDQPKIVERLFKNNMTPQSFDRTTMDPKKHVLCPKRYKGKPTYFYVISAENFEEIDNQDFEDILKMSTKIDRVSRDKLLEEASILSSLTIDASTLESQRAPTIERIKKLDLNAFESTFLFENLFEKHLIDFIQKKDPTIEYERISEETPLLEDESLPLCSELLAIFLDIFCCRGKCL